MNVAALPVRMAPSVWMVSICLHAPVLQDSTDHSAKQVSAYTSLMQSGFIFCLAVGVPCKKQKHNLRAMYVQCMRNVCCKGSI